MWGISKIVAVAATFALVPAASHGISLDRSVAPAAAAASTTPVAAPTPAPAPEFDVDLKHDHDHASGLAPGQSATEFQAWLNRSPANRAGLQAFRAHLVAEGVEKVVPLWQLVRTSSSWRDCGAEPFEAPPSDKWDHIITTLKFVRDKVEPAVGDVEPLSVYRN